MNKIILILALVGAGCTSPNFRAESMFSKGFRVSDAPANGWGTEGALLFRADSTEGLFGARRTWQNPDNRWQCFVSGGLSIAHVDSYTPSTSAGGGGSTIIAPSKGSKKGKGHKKGKGKGHEKHGDDDDYGDDVVFTLASGASSSSSYDSDLLLSPYMSLGLNYFIYEHWSAGVSMVRSFSLDDTMVMFGIGWGF